MKFLNNILKDEPDFARLLSTAEKGFLPAAASGLSRIHKAVLISALSADTGKKITVITPEEADACALCDDLKSLGTKAVYLPSRDYNAAHLAGYSREYEHKRINTLSSLLDGAFDVLVAAVDSALQYTVPPSVLERGRRKLNVGDSLNTDEFAAFLTAAGYSRSELIEGTGQFCVRGGIVDVFPPSCGNPVRIELWGDEIDSIGFFDVSTQRRTGTVQGVEIYPAAELIYNPSQLLERLGEYVKTRSLTQLQRKSIERDIDALSGGAQVPADLYIPFLYEKTATLFDYTEGSLVAVCESGNIRERLKSIAEMQEEDVKNLLESGDLSSATAKLRLDSTEFAQKTQRALFLENFPRASYETSLKEVVSFNMKRSTPWGGDIEVLKEDISYMTRIRGTVVILAGEKKAAKVLCEQLRGAGVAASEASFDGDLPAGGVYVCTGGLSDGFEIPSVKFMLVTHRYISGEKRSEGKHRKKAAGIGSLDELHRGDYVVHVGHGIGIFDGISRITNSKVTKDYIKIKYAGTDVLYVPVTQLDLVSKYIGGSSEEGTVRLNRLGGTDWQRARSRVKAAVKDMAKQLTALYAQRMQTKGYAFSRDTDLQNDFERRFEYEETEDQLRCINEIKKDMESPVPMDRLLCGDVGFGKTEVALRAAFKCVSEGKQCALLVPTTILASQHYNTVLRRFGDMPVEVRLLSRFVSKKEQEKTAAGLRSGRIDMVIGTHRLISKDIKFKNIGLVIIDEEQRFGVAQKERLKELYPFVDILTLSATPIPRTLNMAMSGIRDMSSIDEAPGDRHPVQTYVMEQNSGVLTDAINRELRRGGQVYYLHNRVESIDLCAARLKERLPQARIGVAHGRMDEDTLNRVWEMLIEHEIDVLVCTTIIETGVDVPNVNTLIIENADRMGLSQLHQLRGRVGRSPRRAYAYFCFSRGRELSEVAAKRLEAIRQFTEFGSGFRIAMRDLEIRGAGSILGGEQHGNMEAVGYDMYLKLLAEAVGEEKGEQVKSEVACTVDLNISAHIPEKYISSLPARLGIYKRIAQIRNEEDASDVLDELCDRFGDPPKAVTGLIDIALLRGRAEAAGIAEITGTASAVILHTDKIREQTAAALSSEFGQSFSISAIGEPAYTIRLSRGQKQSDAVTRIAKALS